MHHLSISNVIAPNGTILNIGFKIYIMNSEMPSNEKPLLPQEVDKIKVTEIIGLMNQDIEQNGVIEEFPVYESLGYTKADYEDSALAMFQSTLLFSGDINQAAHILNRAGIFDAGKLGPHKEALAGDFLKAITNSGSTISNIKKHICSI